MVYTGPQITGSIYPSTRPITIATIIDTLPTQIIQESLAFSLDLVDYPIQLTGYELLHILLGLQHYLTLTGE